MNKKDVKESYIDSEIYRFLKNLIDKGFEYNNIKYKDIKFHHPIDGGEADIVVFGEKGGKSIKLIIEAKKRTAKYSEKIDPYSITVFGQALGYAKALDAQFIATTNGDILVLFDAYKRGTILETQIGEAYKIRYNEEFFKQFLSDISNYLSGTLKLLPLGDAFVGRLKYFHELLTLPSFKALKEKLEKDSKFYAEYKNWLEEQGFKFKNETHENVAKQFAYLLMNRILFYKTLETRRKDLNLTPLKSQESDNFLPDVFIKNIKKVFKKIVDEIDYEAVFHDAKILDDIPILPALAEYLNDFIRDIEQYNLSTIKRDVIGHVYERMIPADERKKLGQYYTPPLICDLIAKMCINSSDTKVLDPACGSGGFLISAYSRFLELMNKKESDDKSHNYILSHLYGVDINQFAAHLSVINLSIRNLDAPTNLVNVIASDFFKVPIGQATLIATHKRLSIRGSEGVYFSLPNFDAIIANPPYTRQDEIGDKKYIDFIRQISLTFNNKQIDLSSEAGIYAYFFTHSTHLLKEKGIMGYIVSNSWLDVKFGKDLQKFFLDNFKIECIIDFDKRSFEEAAVNTVIVILQKLTGKENKKNRDDNEVKFIRIKKHLSVNEIINLINKVKESYEDDIARYILVKQKDLYKNHKWSTYLRAPQIYYELIKNKRIINLKDIAKVSVGLVTLANDFFVIPKEKAKKLGIESKFLKPVITTPSKTKFLDIRKSDADQYIFICNLPEKDLHGTNAYKYIKYGETKDVTVTKGHEKGKIVKGYLNLPALSIKKIWYSLGDREPGDIIVPIHVWERWYAIWNKDKISCTHNFYWITPNEKRNLIVLLGILNSILTEFFVELKGKTVYGEGAIELMKHIFDEIPVLNPDKLSDNEKEKIEKSFLKLCDARRSGDNKLEEKTKRELDDAVFDALGLPNKDNRKQIYDKLREMREIRKGKKEVKVMLDE